MLPNYSVNYFDAEYAPGSVSSTEFCNFVRFARLSTQDESDEIFECTQERIFGISLKSKESYTEKMSGADLLSCMG